jgi:ligand-binding SRPBCC domain-containing protein
MKIVVRTRVAAPMPQVMAGFTRELFLKLAPPFPPVQLLRFDGCKVGDEVHLRLNFILFKQTWTSLITDAWDTPTATGFEDQGRQLPLFLGYWRHKHRLEPAGTGTVIIDDIEYQAPIKALSFMLWPVLYLQFAYRKPVYRRVFGAPR